MKKHPLLLILSIISFHAICQTFDPSFTPYIRGPLSVTAAIRQPDNKIIISGTFNAMGSSGDAVEGSIIRLNTDGSRDETFSVGSGPDNTVKALYVLPDGKILAGGYFKNFNGQAVNQVVRLNANGSTDNTFSMGSLPDNINIEKIAVQPDGKILIFGVQTFPETSYYPKEVLMRFYDDGSQDETFSEPIFENLSGAYNLYLTAPFALQPDGKILVGGQFTSVNGTEAIRLARINTDGSLDATFNTNIGTGAGGNTDNGYVVSDIVRQADGKIFVSGTFPDFNSVTNRGFIRLNSDGTADGTFSVTGIPSGFAAAHILVLPDNRVMVAGNSGLKLLTSTGSLDGSLSIPLAQRAVSDLILESGGGVIVAGSFLSFNGEFFMGMARLESDLTTDTGYDPKLSGTPTIYAIHPLSDGSLLIGGNFFAVNDTKSVCIAKVSSTGVVDATFDAGSGFENTWGGSTTAVYAIKTQTDGKILVGGSFNNFNGSASPGFIRLNTDGSSDASFTGFTGLTSGPGFHSYPVVNSIIIEDDDKIIIGGDFSKVNGTDKKHFARLNTNGSLDNTFHSTGTDHADEVLRIDRRTSDSRFILTQSQYTGSGQRPSLSLANTDGSRNTSLNINSLFNFDPLTDAIFLPDGKIVVGGIFDSFNSQPINNLVKVDDTGVRDQSFEAGTISPYTIKDLQLFNNYILTGKINSSGTASAESSFDILDLYGNRIDLINIKGNVQTITPIDATSFLVAGTISEVSGNDVFSIAKINVSPAPTGVPGTLQTTTENVPSRQVSLTWIDGTTGESAFEIQRSQNNNTNFITVGIAPANATTFTDTRDLLQATTYYYRIRGMSLGGVTAFSNENDIVTLIAPPVGAPNNFYTPTLEYNSITLDWDDATNNEASFEIWRSEVTNDNFSLIGSADANATQYTDNTVTAETVYFYKIRAANAGGYSDFSSTIERTTPPSPPDVPLDLYAASVLHNKVTLAWTDASDDETAFNIFRSTGNNTTYGYVGFAAANDTSFIDNSGLTGETTYYYRIRAIKESLYSAYSNEIMVTTAVSPPAQPTYKDAITLGPKSFRISWNDNASTETSYRVYISTQSGGSTLIPHGEVHDFPANTTTFLFTDGTPNTFYYIYVVAVSAAGESLPLYQNIGTAATTYGAWTEDLGVTGIPARSDAVAFSIGSYAYVGTGQNDSGTLKDFWRFDPAANTWTRVTDFPGSARIGAIAFTVNGKGYVGTGNDFSGNGFKRDFYAYDPETDTWTAKADFPEDFSSGAGITGGAAFSIGDYGYAGLGNTGTSNTKAFYRYDPVTDQWEQKADFEGPGRTGAVGFTLNNKGIFAFGSGGLSENKKDAWRYDPATNVWTALNDYQSAGRSGSAVFTVNNQALICAGEEQTDMFTSNKTRISSMLSDQGYFTYWLDVVWLPGEARSSGIAFTIGNQGYFGFGLNTAGDRLADLYTFTPGAVLLPQQPSNILVQALSENSLEVQWTDESTNEEGYIIMADEYTDPNEVWIVLDTADANTIQYLHAGLDANATYRYKVIAFNEYGNSLELMSSYHSTTALPNAPENVNAIARSPYKVQLYWTYEQAVTEFHTIDIYKSKTGNQFEYATWSYAHEGDVYVAGLEPGTGYYFTMRAKSLHNHSEWSDTVFVTTPQGPLGVDQITFSNETPNSVMLDWNWQGVDGGTNTYHVKRSADGGPYEAIGSPTETSLQDTGISPEMLFTYQIITANTDGESTPSSAEYLQVAAASGIQVTDKSHNHITVTWIDNSTNETGYIVIISQNNVVISADTIPPNSDAYTFASLNGNTTYNFKIDALGINSVTPSGIHFETTLPTPPLAPTDLNLTVLSQTSIALSWTDNALNETGFHILRKTPASPEFAIISTTQANISTYTDEDVMPGIIYTYRVEAFSANGNSSYIEGEVTIQLLAPEAPDNLRVEFNTTGLTLLWNDNAEFESGYEIFRSVAGAAPELLTTTAPNITQYTDTDTDALAEYRYTVRAFNTAGFSEMSNEAQLTLTSTESVLNKTNIEIYPSPASERFHINLPEGEYHMEVINTVGIPLWIGKIKGNRAIDCAHWPAGLYLVRISDTKDSVVRKMYKK